MWMHQVAPTGFSLSLSQGGTAGLGSEGFASRCGTRWSPGPWLGDVSCPLVAVCFGRLVVRGREHSSRVSVPDPLRLKRSCAQVSCSSELPDMVAGTSWLLDSLRRVACEVVRSGLPGLATEPLVVLVCLM
jgi:hypothetical protein